MDACFRVVIRSESLPDIFLALLEAIEQIDGKTGVVIGGRFGMHEAPVGTLGFMCFMTNKRRAVAQLKAFEKGHGRLRYRVVQGVNGPYLRAR